MQAEGRQRMMEAPAGKKVRFVNGLQPFLRGLRVKVFLNVESQTVKRRSDILASQKIQDGERAHVAHGAEIRNGVNFLADSRCWDSMCLDRVYKDKNGKLL